MTPTSDPIWLQNMEMELGLAQQVTEHRTYVAGPNALPPFTPGDSWAYNRISLTLAILNGYVWSINKWLDREQVKGTARVRRVYGYYRAFCDWSAVDGGAHPGLQPVLGVVMRLRGLQ